MKAEAPEAPIRWYRVPVEREMLRQLNERSDLRGWLQTGGFLALLAFTGSAAWLAQGRVSWPIVLLILFVHGSVWGFLLNGFHELCHQTVFKTRALNTFFAHVFSLLSWNNVYWFTASHTRHHQHTLHPPRDLEVTLPMLMSVGEFVRTGIVHPLGLWKWIKRTVRLSAERADGAWETRVLAEMDEAGRRRLFNWSRAILAFHILIVSVSIYERLWLLPVLTTLAPFYGGWLLYLLNNTQHVGLMDKTPDFRLCCRTIHVNPFLRFIYWHMNYHIEHHMYAAVPCYNLRKLHRLCAPQLPPTPDGLLKTWRQIGAIIARQRTEPTYQFRPELPATPAA
ncbi:MAG: fatty acid desaturase [Lentisphaerae bacterium]|nr:fatty acid desaturase [Lentisphaerota bacterium]